MKNIRVISFTYAGKTPSQVSVISVISVVKKMRRITSNHKSNPLNSPW